MNQMNNTSENCIIIKDSSGLWLRHRCGQKLIKISQGTVIKNLQYKCKRCKQTILINIEPEPKSLSQ